MAVLVDLYSLSRASFDEILSLYPNVRVGLDAVAAVYARLQILQGLRSIQRTGGLLSGCPEAALEAAAERFRVQRAQAGETLLRQGEEDQSFLLVGEGLLAVERDGQRICALGAGTCIGEHAALTGQPRSATVVVLQRAVLFQADGSVLRDLLSGSLEVGERLEALHQGRLPT